MAAPSTDPHAEAPIRHAGAPLGQAAGVVVLAHGRGASAEDILGLAEAVGRTDWAWLAPQAEGWTWYPHSFLAPLDANEPWLSSALAAFGRTIAQAEAAGIAAERIVLGGFSQGACLASEWTARHPRRWGGLAAFSGGLIGPDGTPRGYAGGFDGMPVFLGCAERDPHIPAARVQETADVLARMGAAVDVRLYPGAAHTINADELGAFSDLLRRVA